MKEYMLEACVDGVESACIATANGAKRLELCSNLIIGGTTPTLALFQEVKKRCDNKIHVLIRPRFGDFCYSEAEFEVIKEEIRQFSEAGADGVVIGILTEEGMLDITRMKACIDQAGTMKITLHRAFDVCVNPSETLEQAINLGIHTILTSGQEDSCMKGIDCLYRLQKQSAGRIRIMAGSGVSADVIEPLHQKTGIMDYHMSGKQMVASKMKYRKENVHMGTEYLSEYEIWQTDGTAIKKATEVLTNITNTVYSIEN